MAWFSSEYTPSLEVLPLARTPTVKHVYSKEFSLDAPVLVIKGPIGSRYIFPIIKGAYEGGADYPDCSGTIHGPAADWALGHVDGSGVTLDVRLICKTPAGAAFYATVVGKSVRDAKDPTLGIVSSAAVFESAVEETKWLNNKIVVGVGKKLGSKIVVGYYLLVNDGSGSPADTYDLKMEHAFSMKFSCGETAWVPNGPAGSRAVSQMISGAFKGGAGQPKLTGTITGPGTYSERTLPEGHEGVCLDVKLTFELPSGANIYVTLTGRRTKSDATNKISTVTTSAMFEVGDDALEFKYLNNKIYHGIGTKDGNSNTLTLDYYEVNSNS